MRKYIVIVRDFNPSNMQPSDTYLFALNMYYRSPIVELDTQENFDEALNTFDKEHEDQYSHFLYRNYELIQV